MEQPKNDAKFLFLNNARRKTIKQDFYSILKKKIVTLESYTQQHSSQKQSEIMSFKAYVRLKEFISSRPKSNRCKKRFISWKVNDGS